MNDAIYPEEDPVNELKRREAFRPAYLRSAVEETGTGARISSVSVYDRALYDGVYLQNKLPC